MAASLAQRAFHWPKSSITRITLEKKKPVREEREQHLHSFPMSKTGTVVTTTPISTQSAQHPSTTIRPSATTTTTTTSSSHSKPTSASDDMATVLIGPQKQRFKVNKKLLCGSSPFFRERIQQDPNRPKRSISLWLPGELPSMFALFVDWLHIPRHAFRRHLENLVAASADDSGPRGLHDMHWALIRLHLFASHLSLYHLQDSAMDAIQDLYLNCDWDVPPGLLTYLYTKCDAIPAVRLRRWAVAMVAFSLTGSLSPSSSPVKLHPEYDWDGSKNFGKGDEYDDMEDSDDVAAQFRRLIDRIPDLTDDYNMHMSKMTSSGLDVRFKNPQLRIPANRLRNDERAFGFRECSFHSHRATVGEKRCPHERKRMRSVAAAAAEASLDDEKHLVMDERDDCGRADVRRMLVAEYGGNSLAKQMEGLTSPSRRPSQRNSERVLSAEPRPLFTDDELEKTVKHVRSISSTMK